MFENILVLLSSYNGEKYIEEQVNSILAQEGVKVKLFVRDDGSSDRTPQILERYKQEGKLDYYIGDNIGWKKSFMQLVRDAPDSDYYAFADQDDHWLPKKLNKAIECMKMMSPGPQLYNSNGLLWKNGKVVGKVSPKVQKFNKYSYFISPLGQGCTQVFNREFFKIVREKYPRIELPHDALFARLATLLGAYYYDSNAYILYRQHDNNQIGAETSFKEKTIVRVKRYAKINRIHYLDIFANEILYCYGDLMDKESYDICYNVANYRKSVRSFLVLFFSPKYRCNNILATLGFKFHVFMRKI